MSGTSDKASGQVFPKGDELGDFIRMANDHSEEALNYYKKPVNFLSSVDALFIDFLKQAAGLSPPFSVLLLLNAHASYRSAVRLAFSGQLLPSFMSLRGAVESALYAHAMVADPKLVDIWNNRGADKKSRDKCRKAFSIGNMFQYLEGAHEKFFADHVRDIYDSTIDFGAHPNRLSVIRSTSLSNLEDGMIEVNFAYLHGFGSFEVRQALVACAEIGLAVFFVNLLCFEEHPQVTELNKQAIDLQDQVPNLINELELGGSVNSD